jgi:hypothetical protein
VREGVKTVIDSAPGGRQKDAAPGRNTRGRPGASPGGAAAGVRRNNAPMPTYLCKGPGDVPRSCAGQSRRPTGQASMFEGLLMAD